MDLGQVREELEKRGYRLGRLLGQGAFSEVYCVEKRRTGESYACKVSGNIRLLRREEEILGDISHPLFAKGCESWQESATGFLVLELVAGENLGEALRRGRTFSARRTAEVGMELAEGLLYLHERQQPILFRDIKPDNIMIRQDGRVKLLDFGCACIAGRDGNSKAGTPGFAAPEQLAESSVQTAACDVYGLGRTLWQLLCTGKSGQEDLGFRERLRENRDRKQLERFLAVCTKEKPSERPADMRAVMAALMPVCSPYSCGRRRREKFWQEGAVCEKNIKKSTYKNS